MPEAAKSAAPAVKFRKFFVASATEKVRVHYSLDNRIDRRNCVTIYARDYGHGLSKILGPDTYKNETDSSTDYFEKGRAVLFETHPLYKEARAFAESLKAGGAS